MTMDVAAGGLRGTIAGEVIVPADSGYDEARSTFNATIDRRPYAIVRPRTTADVVAAVRWARDTDLPIAVRGGGHSVAGHAVADAALVIDLRLMRKVVVDPARKQVRVQGGALWEDVDRATIPHGLATPGGTFGDTGVGGLTLGGGIGVLLGTAGLTCDNLIRAEIVTANGSVVIAGADGDLELLWGLRGGGGNFGIVTEFEFALHPVGPLYAGYLSIPLDAAHEALRAATALANDAPRELTIFGGGPSTDAHDGSEAGASPALLNLGVTYQGTPDQAEPILRPLRALPVVHESLAPMTYLEVQAMSGILPFGLRHYWKGHFVRELDDGVIDSVVAAMGRAAAPSFVLLEALTGAAREEPVDGAAFGQRAARWNVSGLAIWEDQAEDERQIGWVRNVADGLRPASLSGAGYGNYAPVDETPARVRAAFGAERFDRLRRLKASYDPDNVFRFNLNVPPAISS